MKVTAIQCSLCKVVIWSRSRHDCRFCDCKKCFIDGGRAYTRAGWETDIPPVGGTFDTATNKFTVDGEEDFYQ